MPKATKASEHLSAAFNLLPKLSKSQLRLLSDEIAKRLTKSTAEPDPDGDWLLAGVVTELKRHGLLHPTARITVEQARKIRADWNTVSLQNRQLLLWGARKAPNARPPDLIALGRLSARALAQSLAGHPAPLGLQLMLRSIDDLPGAVDKAFPGYSKSGLLSMALGQEVRGG